MADRDQRVAVGADDSLDDVLDRVRAAGRLPVDLIVPADSSLFLAAAEFRTLRDAIDRGRLTVRLRTPDPLRLNLARLHGLEAARLEARPARPPSPPPSPPPAGAPAKSPAVDADAGSGSQVPAPVVRPAPAVTAVPVSSAVATPTLTVRSGAGADGAERAAVATATKPAVVDTTPEAENHGAEGASTIDDPVAIGPAVDPASLWPDPLVNREPVKTPSVGQRLRRWLKPAVPRTPPTPEVAKPLGNGVAARGNAELVAPGDESALTAIGPAEPAAAVGADAGRAWRREFSPRSLPALIVLGVLVLALVASSVYLLLPRTRIEVVLVQAPVNAAVLYDVSASGRPFGDATEIAVAARPVTVDVVFQESIRTTGVRTEPDATASGTLRLANPTANEVIVEAGTIVATEDGVEFAFIEAVTVPPVDAATGDAGQAEGMVQAVAPGTVGNVETGTIGGRLPNGVYYSNRAGPAAGGTDREIPVVSAEDVANLRSRAEAALPELAEAAFAEQFGADGVALISTLRIDGVTDDFDHEAGDDGETLGLRAVRTVTALVFDPEEARREAITALRRQIEQEAPAGFAIDASTISIAPPQIVEERSDGVRFRLAGQAAARAILDDAERRALAERLAGEEPATVEAILQEVPEIDWFNVTYRPLWLPERVPGSADRIEIADGD